MSVTVRLRALDLVARDATAIPMPLSQTTMADALGLTPVHINRTLTALRDDGLLAIIHGELVIKDWKGLQAAADFDPSYLYLGTAH
jgi:CRP-like cAMP-binding protein